MLIEYPVAGLHDETLELDQSFVPTQYLQIEIKHSQKAYEKGAIHESITIKGLRKTITERLL